MPPRRRDWSSERNTKEPVKLPKPAVMFIGGPRDQWCYWADEVDRMATRAQAMGETFDYRPTGDLMVHPGSPTNQTVGVWKYCGRSARWLNLDG